MSEVELACLWLGFRLTLALHENLRYQLLWETIGGCVLCHRGDLVSSDSGRQLPSWCRRHLRLHSARNHDKVLGGDTKKASDEDAGDKRVERPFMHNLSGKSSLYRMKGRKCRLEERGKALTGSHYYGTSMPYTTHSLITERSRKVTRCCSAS